MIARRQRGASRAGQPRAAQGYGREADGEGAEGAQLPALDATARPVLLKKRSEYETSMRMHIRIHMFPADRPSPSQNQ